MLFPPLSKGTVLISVIINLLFTPDYLPLEIQVIRILLHKNIYFQLIRIIIEQNIFVTFCNKTV